MSNQRPIRLAILGGEATGKSSLISRLTVDIVHEVHYPTRKQANWLFDFTPHSMLAKTLLDGQAHERLMQRTPSSQRVEPIFSSPSVSANVLLSPLVYQSFLNDYTFVKDIHSNRSTNQLKNVDLKGRDTPFYSYLEPDKDLIDSKLHNSITNFNANILRSISSHSSTAAQSIKSDELPNTNNNYLPPNYSSISIDIIDTPGFKPDMVVPFLEVSLFTKLDKRVLQGLAEGPRQPVSTTSMLTASGASELNGKVDGYVFVYSAVPELNRGADPPGYESSSASGGKPENASNEDAPNSKRKDSWSSFDKLADGGFSLLEVIRNCILDAWTEYRDYEKRWKLGKEGDVYSLIYSLKSMWKSEKERREKLKQLRSFTTKLNSLNLDPSSPDSPPPCLIVCTHVNDPMASPILIESGKNLGMKWQSGFVAIDSMDDFNVDIALSLIIREIVEKNKLLSHKRSNSFTNSANPIRNLVKS